MTASVSADVASATPAGTAGVDPTPTVSPAPRRPVRLSRPARLALITRHLDLAGTGLEIGPSHNPLLLESEGHAIRIADHLDWAGLIAEDTGVRPTGRIEDVDHALAPGRLTDSVPDRSDDILASQLAEHTVDLIGSLQDCHMLLRPGGVLGLALPDRRFCFDPFQERAALGRVIDVHRAQPAAPTEGSVLEHDLDMVTEADQVAWWDQAPGAEQATDERFTFT